MRRVIGERNTFNKWLISSQKAIVAIIERNAREEQVVNIHLHYYQDRATQHTSILTYATHLQAEIRTWRRIGDASKGERGRVREKGKERKGVRKR